MSQAAPRHRYGGFALILALVALLCSGIAYGSTWATVHTEHTFAEDPEWGLSETNVTLDAEVALRDMEVEIHAQREDSGWFGEVDETMIDTETHAENERRSEGNVSRTFEAMDDAGETAEWLIIIGGIIVLATFVLVFLALSNTVPLKPALLTGGLGGLLVMTAPIAWLLMLPQDGAFTNPFIETVVDPFDEGVLAEIGFEPVPAFGFYLMTLGGVAALGAFAMVVLAVRAPAVGERPGWMVAREDDVLPEVTLGNFIKREGTELSFDFGALTERPKRFILPAICAIFLVCAFMLSEGSWMSMDMEEDDSSTRINFYAEEFAFENDGDEIRLDYGLGFFEEVFGEVGAAVETAALILKVGLTLFVVGLLWRFLVATGAAQRVPALCRHHPRIDTVLMTLGPLLAFAAALWFVVEAPGVNDLAVIEEDADFEGGYSFSLWVLLLCGLPLSVTTFTSGAHGAPARAFLRRFDIPIGEGESDGGDGGITLVNPFTDPRVTALPWVTILGVTLALIVAGAGGVVLYDIVVPVEAEEMPRETYLLEYEWWYGNGSSQDSGYIADGGTETFALEVHEYDVNANSSVLMIGVEVDYDETDTDSTCDLLTVTLSGAPETFDAANSTTSGQVGDCSRVILYLYVVLGKEAQGLDETYTNMTASELDAFYAEYNGQHGLGTWSIDVSIDDQGVSPFENGEDVTVEWYVAHLRMTAHLLE